MPNIDSQQRFNHQHNIAKQLNGKGNLQAARQKYRQIIREFENNKSIDYVDYIVVITELGDVEKSLNLISESKARYYKAYSLLCKAPKDVSNYEIQKQKYHLLSNLGLIFCHEVLNIDLIKDYKKFRNLLDENLKSYKICEEIVVKMIIENQDKLERNQDQKKHDWWKQQYVGLIVNLLNVLSMEGFEFQDKQVMDLMVRLISKAQEFYELCKNSTKEHLKNLLSKTYYYKAVCLKFLGKKQESLKYFNKDFDHCKGNVHLKDDLRKTKEELYKFYLESFRFDQARQVFKTKDHYANVNEKERQFKDVMRKAESMKSQLKKGQNINANQLQGILFDLHQLKCPQKSLEFNYYMRQAPQFKTNPDFRYWIQYYAAQYSIKLGKFQQAAKYLKQAIKIKGKEPNQKGWCSLLNAIILDNTQKDRTRVYQAYERCVIQSIYGDEDCQIQCKKQFQEFKLNQERKKNPIRYDMTLSQKLIEHMKQMKMKKNQQKSSRMQIQPLYIQQMVPQSIEQEIYRPQIKKLIKKLNEVESYIQNCKILDLQPIEVFKQLLNNPNREIDLSRLIYFDTSQLLALLNSTSNISCLDLRNFVMTTQYLRKIKECNNSNCFKSIKISMINASIINSNDQKEEFYQQLYSLLKSNPLLEYLLISNAYQIEYLTKIIHSKDIIGLQSLTVLKLKQCQLQDKDLIFFSIGQHLPQLKKLSLSGNKLQGRTLQVLTSLKQLQSLSLSSNPLKELSLTRRFESLTKISLNNLSRQISSQVCALFIPLLANCEVIKMKNCESVCEEILVKLIENVMDLQTSLYCLKKLIFFGSQLKGVTIVQTLTNLERKAPNLLQIDLRNAKIISAQNNNYLIQSQLKQLQTVFDGHNRFQFYQEIQNPSPKKAFKTANISFVDQPIPKRSKNFSIN